MKVSLNTIKYYLGEKKLPYGSIDELVQKVGAQLGAVEEVIEFTPRYEKIFVTKVVSCVKHENADKLHVCLIDDGGATQNVERNQDGLVQVVCGAPNVAEGLTVAWVSPGATVPSTFDKDPFIVDSREIRGVLSNGMLASASELGINDDHSGLLVIDLNDVGEELTKPGTELSKLYELGDTIFDIENKMFTHRPDCFGLLGVAREIFGIYNQPFSSPDWYLSQPSFENVAGLELAIENQLPELSPRFMAVAVEDVEVKASPIWLQVLLSRIGVKSINNIVDLTNYTAYITGQPLHAYDYDKVAQLSNGSAKLVVRFPEDGERVALLNGKTISPRKEAIMIATDKELIGIGGVMGGSTTEVDNSTKNIIIECANFDMYSIRRTSMEHGLFTEAVTRFTKGQSSLQNDRVLWKIMHDIFEMAGGSQASPVLESPNFEIYEPSAIHISPEFINNRLGTNLHIGEIQALLSNVEFAVSADEDLGVKNAFWRTDIEIKEDIVEEVGRLVGFDKLPNELPQRSVSPAKLDSKVELKKKLRHSFASYGANELLTYSFVNGDLLKKSGQDPAQAFKLSNALSPDLQYFRMSLTPSLLVHIHPNIKLGHDSFALFEINKTHIKLHKDDDNGVPKELEMAAMVVADKSSKSAGYFKARAYLDAMADELGIQISYSPLTEPVDYQVLKPFDFRRSALVSVKGTDVTLGIIGEYASQTVKALKLPGFCAGFEIGLDAILESTLALKSNYVPLSRFPGISQDVCFETSLELPFGTLANSLEESLVEPLEADVTVSYELIDVYSGKNIGDKKRMTFRVLFVSYDRTLTEEIATRLLDSAAEKVVNSLNITRI